MSAGGDSGAPIVFDVNAQPVADAGAAFDTLGAAMDAAAASLTTFGAAGEQMMAAFTNLSTELTNAKTALDDYGTTLASTQGAVDDAAAAQENYISILSGAGTAQTDAAAAAEQLTGSLTNVGTSLNDSVGGLTEYNTVIGQVGTAQSQAASTSEQFAGAIQDNILAIGVAASGILGIVESITRLERAELLAEKASLAFQQALATEAASTLKLQSTIDKYGASSAQAAIASQKLAVAHEKTGLAAERADVLQQQLAERQAAFAINIIPNVIQTVTGMISAFTALRAELAGVTAANLLAAASFRILLVSTGVGAIIAIGTFFLGEWMNKAEEARVSTEALSGTFEQFSKATGTSVGGLGTEFTDAGGQIGEATGVMGDSISGLAANVPTDLAKILADTAAFKEQVVTNLTITEADKAKVTKVAPGVTLPTETEAERQRRLGTGVGQSQFGEGALGGGIKIPSLTEMTGLVDFSHNLDATASNYLEFSDQVIVGNENIVKTTTEAAAAQSTLGDIIGLAGESVRTQVPVYQEYLKQFGLIRPLTVEASAAVVESIAKITQASRTLTTDPRSAFVIAAEMQKLQELIAVYNKYGTVTKTQQEINEEAAKAEQAKTDALNQGVQATIEAAAAGEIQLGSTLKLGDVTAMWVEQLGVASQAEQVAIADLKAYAAAHNIVIPITAQSADAIQEFIQQVEGVGPAAQKASQEFVDGFFKMADSLGKAADDGKQFWKDMKDSMLPKDFKREVKEKLDVREDVQQFLQQFAIDAQLAQMLGASNSEIGKFRDNAVDALKDLQKDGSQAVDDFLQPLIDILKDPALKGEALVDKALAWVKDPQIQAAAKALNIDLTALDKTLSTLNGTAQESANLDPLGSIIEAAKPGQKLGFGTEGSTGFVDLGTAPGGTEEQDKAVQASIDLMKIYNTTATTLSPVTIPAPVKDAAFDSTITGALAQLQTLSGGGGTNVAGGGTGIGGGPGGAAGPGGGGTTGLTPLVIPAPDPTAFQTAVDEISGILLGLDAVFLSVGAAALIANDTIVSTLGTLAKSTATFTAAMFKELVPIIELWAQLGQIPALANDAIIEVYGILDKSTKNWAKAMTKDLGPVLELYIGLGTAAIASGEAIVEVYAILEKATKAWLKPMTKELTPVVDLYFGLGAAALASAEAILGMYEIVEKESKAWLKPMTKALQPIIDLYADIGITALVSLAAIQALAQDSVKEMASAQKQLAKTASAIVSTFGSIGSAAASAAGQVNALASAINSLKDKTVTVTYKQVGKPSQYGRHEVADTPSLYIAGEAFQPEEVRIRPLWSRGFETAENERLRREEQNRKYSGIASMMQRMAEMSRQRTDNIVFTGGGEGGSARGISAGKIKQLIIDLKSDVIVDRREIMSIVRKYLYELED